MSDYNVKLTLEQISIVRSWAITTFQGYEMPSVVLDLLNRLDASERLSEGNQDAVEADIEPESSDTGNSDEIQRLQEELTSLQGAMTQLLNCLFVGTPQTPRVLTASQRRAISQTMGL